MSRSDGWRINKSSLMSVEGAQALRALQKVAGAAGLDKSFKVRFATKEDGSSIDLDKNIVSIGGGRIFQEAPIPPEKFDVLVGLTLHEVGHQQIQTDKVWGRLSGWDIMRLTSGRQDEMLLRQFVNIGEDIAIESMLAENPNLTDYGDALFDWATKTVKQVGREADPSKLLELWIEFGLLHKTDNLFNLPPEMQTAMDQLVGFTHWLRHTGKDKHGYEERARAYESYWQVLKSIIKSPPEITKPDKDVLGQNEDGENQFGNKDSQDAQNDAKEAEENENEWNDWGDSEQSESGSPEPANPDEDTEDGDPEAGEDEDSEDEEEDGEEDEVEGGSESEDEGELEAPLAPKPGDGIDSDLAKAIEEAIQSNSEDVTSQVMDAFTSLSRKSEASYPIIRSRETQTQLIKPDQGLCKRLERISTIRKRLQARIMHGEQYGRIDKRHLHRARTDGRVFNLRYKFPDGFPNTRILIDLSGSMSGRQADEVLQAAGALQTIANAEVWCYNHDGRTINLVRMDEGKLIRRFEPEGGTPSGAAIVGISLGMKPGGLIIHLTDGDHNSGQSPWNANWVIKKRGVELVNLIWGRNVGHYDIDGMNFVKLNGLADFPDALYRILVQQAKLGNIGG